MHNRTLSALIRAVENGDEVAHLALADHFEELDAFDLAAQLRAEKAPAKAAYDLRLECFYRRLLLLEQEPTVRQEAYQWADAWRKVDMKSIKPFPADQRRLIPFDEAEALRGELRRHAVKRFCVVSHRDECVIVNPCHPTLAATPPTVMSRMIEFLDRFFPPSPEGRYPYMLGRFMKTPSAMSGFPKGADAYNGEEALGDYEDPF
jgi:hypothetical protein